MRITPHVVAVVLLAAAIGSAHAQSAYPARPIRMVAPFAAGGLVDVLARAVGEKLRPALGQPVVIDNRPAAAGIKITHVPYKSAAEAVLAVISGQIQGVMDNPPTVLSHIKAGTLRAVAVASPRRLPQLPDVPTFDEAGLKGVEALSWFGMVAPANTPRAIVTRLNTELVRALREPDMQNRFTGLGARLAGNTPDEFAAYIKAERAKWSKIVRDANIKLN